MKDCDADVDVDFDEDGTVTFRIDAGDCKDSEGDFDFEGEIENTKGAKRTIRKTETWTRTGDRSTAKVEYDFRLYDDEKLNEVTLIGVNCRCYSD